MTRPASSASSDPFERSCRRWLRVFPSGWRHRREEEVLTVLLDASRPGQQRLDAAQGLDLAGAAALAWSRATAALARRAPGTSAGALVLVTGLVWLVLPAAAVRQSEPVALPDVLPGYSYVTASASSSPPGPAVALYQQGYGVELADAPQAVVVGAGGAVRRLDLAEARGEGAQGDPGAMLLSPDGRRVAVGRYDDDAPDIALQDLTSGAVTHSAVVAGRAVLPLAWSPDSRALLAVVRDAPWNPYSVDAERGASGTPVLVGVDGAVSTLPPGAPSAVVEAAFSPDGRQVALQAEGGSLVVLDRGSEDLRTLEATGSLLGQAAWSPDGRWLAVRRACAVGLVPTSPAPTDPVAPSGSVGSAAECVPGLSSSSRFVGWATPSAVVVGEPVDASGAELDPQPVVAVDAVSGGRTVLSGVPTASANYVVSRLQVPAVALAGAAGQHGTAPSPGYDHGRGALVLQVLALVLLAGAVALLVAAAAALARRASHLVTARRVGGRPGLS